MFYILHVYISLSDSEVSSSAGNLTHHFAKKKRGLVYATQSDGPQEQVLLGPILVFQPGLGLLNLFGASVKFLGFQNLNRINYISDSSWPNSCVSAWAGIAKFFYGFCKVSGVPEF